MKPAGLVVCAVVSVGLVSAARGAEVTPAAATHPVIHRAMSPVRIDGMLDEPCWQRAEPVPVCFLHDRSGEAVAPVPMTARYAWDEHYLYIGYDVSDTNLVAPVRVGRNATIGAGSTITKDAPADTLTLSRARQATREGWKRPTKIKRD